MVFLCKTVFCCYAPDFNCFLPESVFICIHVIYNFSLANVYQLFSSAVFSETALLADIVGNPFAHVGRRSGSPAVTLQLSPSFLSAQHWLTFSGSGTSEYYVCLPMQISPRVLLHHFSIQRAIRSCSRSNTVHNSIHNQHLYILAN